MRLLLDTHAILWFLDANPKLPVSLRDAICEYQDEAHVSVLSFWEIALKVQKGRLVLPFEINDMVSIVRKTGFRILPLQSKAIPSLLLLPVVHKDPFDRMLIAQAMSESMVLVSQEELFDKYGVKRMW